MQYLIFGSGNDGDCAGKIKRFAMDITQQWCARENISLVVRSHEYNPSGFLVMHGGRLITVFSARNYMDTALNDSALLLLTHDDTRALRVRIKTLSKRSSAPNEAVQEQFGTIKAGSPLLDAIEIRPLTRSNSEECLDQGGEDDVDNSDHSGVIITKDGKIREKSKDEPATSTTGRRGETVNEKGGGFVAMLRRRVVRTFKWSA